MAVLEVQHVDYDYGQNHWSVTATVTNASTMPITIAIDGDTSNLPRVHVPPAYVVVEQFQDGQWVDMMPLSDALGVQHLIEPGRFVTFDTQLPSSVEAGTRLRLGLEGIVSEPFSIPRLIE